MKFTMAVDRVRTVFHSTGEEFDGVPPIQRFDVGAPVKSMTPDRTAVALAMLFHPWIAGTIVFPEAISPLVANRITQFFGARTTLPSPVRGGDWPILRGARRIRITTPETESPSRMKEHLLSLTSLARQESFASAPDRTAIPSSLYLLRPPALENAHQIQLLGLGALLAADLQGRILVTDRAHALPPEVSLLLDSVGLGLAGA